MEQEQQQDNVFNPLDEEINIIQVAGAQGITRLQRKYTPVQMQIIEERAKFTKLIRKLEKKIHFWESGTINNTTRLLLFCSLAAIIGYILQPQLSEFYTKILTFITPRTCFGIFLGAYAATVFNIYDIGRINLSYQAQKEKEYRKSIYIKGRPLEEIILQIYRVPNEKEEGKVRISVSDLYTKIEEKLKGDNRVLIKRNIGVAMKKLGFKQVRMYKQRLYDVLENNTGKEIVENTAVTSLFGINILKRDYEIAEIIAVFGIAMPCIIKLVIWMFPK